MKAFGGLIFVPLLFAGCAFDNGIAVDFTGTAPVAVKESFDVQQAAQRAQGVTTKPRQVVRVDCSVTIVYDVTEAGGAAVLPQTYVAHLRTRRLRLGVPYAIDCSGPLIVEVPAAATNVKATANQVALPLQFPVSAVAISRRKRLRADRSMQFALVHWPDALQSGSYDLELDFDLPTAKPFREKVIDAATVSCGRSTYMRPFLPAVTRMARVPSATIAPSAGGVTIPLPRIAGANSLYAEKTLTLSC
jgi:hypothetical protein